MSKIIKGFLIISLGLTTISIVSAKVNPVEIKVNNYSIAYVEDSTKIKDNLFLNTIAVADKEYQFTTDNQIKNDVHIMVDMQGEKVEVKSISQDYIIK